MALIAMASWFLCAFASLRLRRCDGSVSLCLCGESRALLARQRSVSGTDADAGESRPGLVEEGVELGEDLAVGEVPRGDRP